MVTGFCVRFGVLAPASESRAARPVAVAVADVVADVVAVAVAVAVVVVARDGSRARGAARSRSARRRPVDIGADDAIGNDASNRRCRVA